MRRPTVPEHYPCDDPQLWIGNAPAHARLALIEEAFHA